MDDEDYFNSDFGSGEFQELSPDSEPDLGLSVLVIVGIVGAILVLIILVTVILIVVNKLRKAKPRNSIEMTVKAKNGYEDPHKNEYEDPDQNCYHYYNH